MKKGLKLLIIMISIICIFTSCTAIAPTPPPKSENAMTISELKGEKEQSVYENKKLKLGFTLPQGWRFYSDEETQQIFGAAGQNTQKNNCFYDMFATSSDSKAAVYVVIEEKNAGTAGLSLEKMVENTIELVKKDYEQIYDSVDIKTKELEIGQTPYCGYITEFEHEGVKLYQGSFMTDMDKFAATFTITAMTEEEINALTDCFYSVQ